MTVFFTINFSLEKIYQILDKKSTEKLFDKLAGFFSEQPVDGEDRQDSLFWKYGVHKSLFFDQTRRG
jgi:hypothetical protein